MIFPIITILTAHKTANTGTVSLRTTLQFPSRNKIEKVNNRSPNIPNTPLNTGQKPSSTAPPTTLKRIGF
jgi:hypothetical protein